MPKKNYAQFVDEVLPKQICQTDAFTGENWVDPNPVLHIREGFSNIKIKTRDSVTDFIIEKTFPVTYKSDLRDLFQINKTQKMSDIYIDNASAHSSYGVSLELQPLNSEILSPSIRVI